MATRKAKGRVQRGTRTSKPARPARGNAVPVHDRDKLDPKHKAKRPKKKTTSKRPRKKY